MTEDVLTKEYNVSIVVHGNTVTEPDVDGSDPYAVSSCYNDFEKKKKKKTKNHSSYQSNVRSMSKLKTPIIPLQHRVLLNVSLRIDLFLKRDKEERTQRLFWKPKKKPRKRVFKTKKSFSVYNHSLFILIYLFPLPLHNKSFFFSSA